MNSFEQTYLSIEEIISLPTLSHISISEDGNYVAYVKKTADWKDNIYRNQVWLYEQDKGQCHPLNNDDIDETSPLWSPDSRYLAYLALVGNGYQIFVKSMASHRVIQITDEKEGVGGFKWAPSGKGFYYVAQSNESDAIMKRNDLYGDFHYVGKEYRNNCLYYIEMDTENINTSVVHPLIDSKRFHVQDFNISSDGGKVAFIATPTPDTEDYLKCDLYILDIKANKLDQLNRDRLLGGSLCFSPDGTQVCYTASIMAKDYYKIHNRDSLLEIYDLNKGTFSQPLTDFNSTVTPISWTSNGILIQWLDKTNYLMGLLSEDGTVDLLCEKTDCCIIDVSITRNGKHIAYNKATSKEVFEIYVDHKQITHENAYFEGKLKSNRKIISWKNNDGFEIEGVLTTPISLDTNKKHPLLVVVHGGPNGVSLPIPSACLHEKYPIEQFIEKGFIVLEPNYRGSSGYGHEFLKASYRNLGIGDYEDIISGVDALVEKGIADKDKVGVMGWSQGGYISAFCSTSSDRFKAISVGGGISNWTTHYVNTDLHRFPRMYLGDTPWNDPEIYAKTSPITYIKSACTPTLIQHGEADVRVPISNAYELYQGLRDMKVDTELVIFKGMGYSSNKPGVNKAIMKQNLMWFSHYVLGESMDDFSLLG